MANLITRKLIVTGRVQGVGFRAFVYHHASGLGLDGFVRNLRDGTVEVLVSGESEKVEALITHCRKGPPASRVEDVAISDAAKKPEKGFVQLQTV